MTHHELIQVLEAPTDIHHQQAATMEFWTQFDSHHRQLLDLQREIAWKREHNIKPCRVLLQRLPNETIGKYLRPTPATKPPAGKTAATTTPVRKTKTEAEKLFQNAEWLHLMLDMASEAHTSTQAQALCHQIQQILIKEDEKLINRFGLQITRTEAQLLSWRQPRWLNDNIINFYLELIVDRSRTNPGLPSIYAMNTFFVHQFIQFGYPAVKSWTRRLKPDIFTYDMILVPIHAANHWRLGIVHPAQEIIEHYDSLGSDGSDILPHLLQYIKSEYEDKKKTTLNTDSWTTKSSTTPRQTNNIDCGIFICSYAAMTATGSAVNFNQEDIDRHRQRIMCEIMTNQLIS